MDGIARTGCISLREQCQRQNPPRLGARAGGLCSLGDRLGLRRRVLVSAQQQVDLGQSGQAARHGGLAA
jgi:hypothetical protein